MNCQEYKGMIEDALDVSLRGELKANIQRHLEHCSECREYLTKRRLEHSALFAGVNAAYSHLRSPPADFADRIVREVAARRSARRGWRRFALSRWALIAASLVAVAGFVFAATVVVGGLRGTEAANQDTEAANQGDEIANQGDEAVNMEDEMAGHDALVAPQTGAQLKPNKEGETKMRKGKAAAAALSAAMAAAPLAAANGDEYQFINPDTYPAANVSYSARSTSVEIDAGALRIASAADGLEARSRTKCASDAIALETTKFNALLIIFH